MKCYKKRFETKALAKKWRKDYNKTHSYIKLTNEYYCDSCMGFHLTSMEVVASRRLTRFKNKIMGHVRTVTISYDEYQELKEGKYTSLIEELNEANSNFAEIEKDYNGLRLELADYRARVDILRGHIKHLEKVNASLRQFDDSWFGRLFTKTKNK